MFNLFPILGFHLDENARKRLIELVQRQKNASTAAKQTRVSSPVGSKKDAALQTNLDSSFGISTKKHEAVQVMMEELEDGIDAGFYEVFATICSLNKLRNSEEIWSNLFLCI